MEYVTADGSVLKVGDTLIIGTPSGRETNTYGVGAGKAVCGAVAKSKTKSCFANILMGKPWGAGNVMMAMNGTSLNYASADMQGEIVLVAKMKVFHKGSRKKPLRVSVLLGEPNGRAFGINKYMSTQDYEKTVLTGELRALHAPLTREQAIAKLKEAKELFELGLMEKEEFEKIKGEMAKIIMKK